MGCRDAFSHGRKDSAPFLGNGRWAVDSSTLFAAHSCHWALVSSNLKSPKWICQWHPQRFLCLLQKPTSQTPGFEVLLGFVSCSNDVLIQRTEVQKSRSPKRWSNHFEKHVFIFMLKSYLHELSLAKMTSGPTRESSGHSQVSTLSRANIIPFEAVFPP